MPKNERLRQHRIQRNWRQQDLADQLQTSLVTIQRWERGSHQPRAYYCARLCTLFGTSAEALGLVEASSSPALSAYAVSDAAQVHAASCEETMLWTVPYARNPHFTGCATFLDYLKEQFLPFASEQLVTRRTATITQIQAITGLGGIGKTQIAVEYAYRAREQGRFTHTLWITAVNEEAILTSFAALAELLPAFHSQGEKDQRKLVASIIRWLEQCEQPWLLIFDNADDLSFLQPYLPQWGNGSILLTSRASAAGALASTREVETMGLLEGTQLLLRRAQRFVNASDEEINEASNVVMALGQFPLALDQAGAYIEETRCSLQDYLQLYQTHQHALLARRGRQATPYPESVVTTWSLSFDHLKQNNPAAFDLLRLCAFLSPDHIPEELLIQGAPYWPPALREAVSSSFTFDQMLEALLAFSLVKRWSEDHLLSLHPLVQVVQMETMSLEEQRQWATRVVCGVNAIFPRNPKNVVDTWPLCLRYLEQAEACTILIQQQHLLLPEAAELLYRTGTYLREHALYTLAEPLYLQALSLGAGEGCTNRTALSKGIAHHGFGHL